MSKLQRKLQSDKGMVLALFLMLLTRACASGVAYWPQLDDYIQHHNYLQSGGFAELQEKVGILAARPLAGVADYFIWGRLFSCMIVGVAIISLLYALTAVMLRRQFSRYFTVGPVFLVIFTLLPLGVEGTYWMSASTRIVCGLFFAALSAGAFLRWMDTGNWGWALGFAVLQLLPIGFYEQSGIFSVTLVVGLAILEVLSSRKRLKRAVLSLWSLPAMGVYFLFTRMVSSNAMFTSRAEVVLPTDPWWGSYLLPQVLEQFREVFITGNCAVLLSGFSRGIQRVVSGQLLVWLIVMAGLTALFVFVSLGKNWEFCGRKAGRKLSVWLELVAGVLLFVAPLTVFLFLNNPWFSFRGAVSSFAGMALLCDMVIMNIWRHLPGYQRGPSVAAALLALVFCLAGASEIGDYCETYKADQKVTLAVSDALKRDFPLDSGEAHSQRIGVLNVLPSYLEEQNYYYHEHIHGCTESDWAFQGLLTALMGQNSWNVTPLAVNPVYYNWNRETHRPETFDALYYYNGEELERVTLEQTGEHEFYVRSQQGELIGEIWEEDGLGYFEEG